MSGPSTTTNGNKENNRNVGHITEDKRNSWGEIKAF
jgi:hypothetical protein